MKTKSNLIFVSVLLIAGIFTCIYSGCKKDEVPKIVDCNSVEYKGETYNNIGCAPGVASFDVDITIQDGPSASFHVTCSDGCIATVAVKE